MSRRRKAASGPVLPPTQRGGFSTEILVIAALVASPALYRSLVQDLMPLEVALQRFVIIAAGCWLLASLVAALLPTGGAGSSAEGSEGPSDDAGGQDKGALVDDGSVAP